MPQYVLFLHENATGLDGLPPDEVGRVIQRYIDWMHRLQRDGRYVGGEKLRPARSRVRRVEEKLVTDGPYVEAKEIVGGYFVITAESHEDAVKQTHDSPHYDYGWIEVREVEPT